MRMKKGKVKHEPVIIQPIQNTEDDIVPDSPKVKKKKKKKNKQKSDEEALDETFASNVKSETEDNFSDTTSFMESVETSSQQSEYIDDTPRKKKKEKKSKQKSNAKALDETFASNVKPETADNFSDTTSFMESVETSSQQSECIDDTPRKKKKKKIKREVEKLVPFPEEEEEESKEIENKKEKKNGVLETDDKKTSSKSKSDTLQPWSKEKLDRLINQIEAALPKNDNLKYCSRLAKLDWKAISFDEYSPEECQETWRQIQNKIRCYRILKEILHDAREYVNQNDPFTHNGSRKYKSDGLGFAKPKSAFQLFHQSMREKHPSRAPGELLERCKIKWKSMSEKKKVVWIETAQQEEARYKEELRKYQLEHPEYVPPPMKTLITKQDKHILDHFSGKPKKPAVNAYSLYSQESLQNGSLKEIPAKDRLAEISRRWKALSQQQRDAYVTRCEQLQKEYKIEYQKYLDTLPPEKRSEELEKMLPKKRKTDSKGSPAKKIKISEPVQPPVNEFELFKQKHENEWDKSSPFSIDDQARAKWKKVPKNEKEKYSQELKKLKNQYISSLTEYLKHCPPEKLAYYVSLIASQQHNLGSGKVIMSSEDDNFDIDSE